MSININFVRTVRKKSNHNMTKLIFKYGVLSVFLISLFFYVYTIYSGSREDSGVKEFSQDFRQWFSGKKSSFVSDNWTEKTGEVNSESCLVMEYADTDIDTTRLFPTLKFQAKWIGTKGWWNQKFEERYAKAKSNWLYNPLKVIVVPHSHNDPGWLKTYELYYHAQTSHILNNMVEKLKQHKNMTFIWTEISFFSKWWNSAHPLERKLIKKFIQEGRFEIASGGWVMTDEATVHLYSMVNQYLDGHQWVKHHLNVVPKSSWSVDPFGHGGAVPYLLSRSGIKQMVIQRIHYAWKKWLAEYKADHFQWRQSWDVRGKHDVLCHNLPYDIYSIKHSCGPFPDECLAFDFRKVTNEYSEASIRSVPITDENVKQKAETLIEQYGRTGSLFAHNVVLVPLGDDFRYDRKTEWDQQYLNYIKLFDYINSHQKELKAEVRFGTLSTYFEEVGKRMKDFPTLQGDFFPYSDIFSEGRPAYWTGYYTTRPYYKALSRELEAALRKTEILYTFAISFARRHSLNKTVQMMENYFESLVKARENMNLFQHHDAITGTSKSFVMEDYGLKMFEALQTSQKIQVEAIQTLIRKPNMVAEEQTGEQQEDNHVFLLQDFDQDAYDKLPIKLPVIVKKDLTRHIVIFNCHAQDRQHVVSFIVQTPQVDVLDSEGNRVHFQINPVWNDTIQGMIVTHSEFEVIVVADFPALSIVTFTVVHVEKDFRSHLAVIYSNNVNLKDQRPIVFQIEEVLRGDIQLENTKIKLLFDGDTGLLKAITKKENGRRILCQMKFGAYRSSPGHSGAYLFKPDSTEELDLLQGKPPRIFITSGTVLSELSVIYGSFIMFSLRIYHVAGPLSEGIQTDTIVNYPVVPNFRETELFMRFVTDIKNGPPGVVFTDQSGLHMVKRKQSPSLGIEGNYYPITAAAYIEDDVSRLNLFVSHAHGAAVWPSGILEVMLERRTMFDDVRGVGEGVVDQKRTHSKFWLLLEERGSKGVEFSRLSLLGNYLMNGLNYPPLVLVADEVDFSNMEKHVRFLNRPFPCDVFLLTLRTLSDLNYYQLPSSSALMILYRQGYSCDYYCSVAHCDLGSGGGLHKDTTFNHIKLETLVETSLTGLKSLKTLSSLNDIEISPMELRSYNMTFLQRLPTS